MSRYLQKLTTFSPFHEGALNLVAPIAVGSLLGFASTQLLLTVIGSYLVDIDHILHCFLKRKFRIPDIVSYLHVEFTAHRPHIYVFHIVEVLFLMILIASYHSPAFTYLLIGFSINIVLDIATYLIKYRSFNPWLRFFFGTYNLYYHYKRNGNR